MVPYSNRIENGYFTFEGKQHQLANGKKHAIHGDTRTRAWSIESKTDSSIVCFFSSAEYRDINWPWTFDARIEYHIRDNVFSSRLTLWNRGDTSMPAGMGWHPYFNRCLSRTAEPVHLRMRATGAYPDAYGSRIPSGPPQPLTEDQDFSVEKALLIESYLDTCFHGYDGNGSITWPASGVRVTYDCSPECGHLIIFNPPETYFAIEPVTNANNGVNRFSQGWPDSGIVALSPGESLQARFTLKVDIF